MRTTRHLERTLRGIAVTLAILVGTGGALDAADDQGTALRRAARRDVPLSERLEAVQGVLAAERIEAPEAALRAGVSLLGDAPEVAAWLLKAGADAHFPAADLRRTVAEAIDARVAGDAGAALDPLVRARLAAAGSLFGLRPDEAPAWTAAAWGADRPFLEAVILPELGRDAATAAEVEAGLREALPALRALDDASLDERERSRAGLDTLRAMGGDAVPTLVAEVRRAVDGLEPGRRERATRAILVLGMSKDRRATDVLIDAVESTDGWVRAYAATALGDLGDPRAVIALTRQATILGDPLRDRDQWEYPGSTNTTVPEADWQSVAYYTIDTLALDSLLRLGVRGALGRLIHIQLDPRQKNYRIRVLQDATDAVKRSAPSAPIDAYNVDQGLPQREAAFETLAHWWHDHRFDDKVLETELDPSDPRFHAAALAFIDVLSGEKGVREMMMANAAIDLLGPLLTKALIERAHAPKSEFHKAEIAQALGRVRDVSAVDTLVEIVRDRTPFVRAKAALGLGPYAREHEGARKVLLQLVRSRNAAVRVAALQALVHAPRDPEVKAAFDAWLEADRARVAGGNPSWRTPDVLPALAVLRFVQDGASAWAPVEAGLRDEQRVMRRTWWDLLRDALDVPEYLHDPVADPGDPEARVFTKQMALDALEGEG